MIQAIVFAVKTMFLNTWLLKAQVESPLGGSIILAGIVLKLSLYGILRLILPLLPKASLDYTYVVYLIGVSNIYIELNIIFIFIFASRASNASRRFCDFFL